MPMVLPRVHNREWTLGITNSTLPFIPCGGWSSVTLISTLSSSMLITSSSRSDNSTVYLIQISSANILHSLEYDLRKSDNPGILRLLIQKEQIMCDMHIANGYHTCLLHLLVVYTVEIISVTMQHLNNNKTSYT